MGGFMNEKFNDTICAFCTLIIVVAMVGAAQITGEKEIIFPEITAIAVGMLLAPKRSWQTSKLRILILITICAISGVLIVLFLPVTKPLQMTFAFAVCQIIFLFSRTTFAPLISAMVLPVMLGTENIIYIIAAIVLTTLILLSVTVLEYAGIKEPEPYEPTPLPQKQDFFIAFVRCIFAALFIFIALHIDFRFAVAPPLLVAFTEFTRPGCKALKKPVKAVLLIGVCAFAGSACRYVLTMRFGLWLTISAAAATILMIFILRGCQMFLPPAGALTILAMLIPESYVVIYPLQILTGAGILMFTARMLQKVKMLKLRES